MVKHQVGGQAVLGRQGRESTPWHTERHGYDPTLLPYKLYQAQSDTIVRLAEEGPCVFVGRCAEHILRQHHYDDLLNVFIYASSMDQRRQRAIKVDHISEKEADSYIAKKDKERRDYYYFHTGKEWGVMENYDLCLNTTTMGYQLCADVIRDALRRDK